MSRTAFTQKVASEVVAGMPLDMTKEAHVRVLPELVLVRENYYVLKVSIPRISIPTYVADVAQLESNDWKLSSIKFVFDLLGHNVTGWLEDRFTNLVCRIMTEKVGPGMKLKLWREACVHVEAVGVPKDKQGDHLFQMLHTLDKAKSGQCPPANLSRG